MKDVTEADKNPADPGHRLLRDDCLGSCTQFLSGMHVAKMNVWQELLFSFCWVLSYMSFFVFFDLGSASSKCKVSSSWSQLDMMHVYIIRHFDAGCCKKTSLALEAFGSVLPSMKIIMDHIYIYRWTHLIETPLSSCSSINAESFHPSPSCTCQPGMYLQATPTLENEKPCKQKPPLSGGRSVLLPLRKKVWPDSPLKAMTSNLHTKFDHVPPNPACRVLDPPSFPPSPGQHRLLAMPFDTRMDLQDM